MTRDELKAKLEEMGVSIDLLEMPAVMERLYFMFDVEEQGPYQVEEVDKIVLDGENYSRIEDVIKLDEEGNMMLKAKDGSSIGRFSKDPYGDGATFVNENYYGAIYYIDKYGMDKGFLIRPPVGGGAAQASIDRTDEGKFVIDGMDQKFIPDDGRPIINYQDIKNEFDFEKFRNALPSMSDNREFLLPKYPSVGRWFRDKIIDIIERHAKEAKEAGGDDVPSFIDETIVGIASLKKEIEEESLSNPESKEYKARMEKEQASMKARMATLQRQSEEIAVQNQKLAKSLEGAVKLNQSLLQELSKGAISKRVNKRIIEKYAPEMLKEEPDKTRDDR